MLVKIPCSQMSPMSGVYVGSKGSMLFGKNKLQSGCNNFLRLDWGREYLIDKFVYVIFGQNVVDYRLWLLTSINPSAAGKISLVCTRPTVRFPNNFWAVIDLRAHFIFLFRGLVRICRIYYRPSDIICVGRGGRHK